MFKIIFHRKAEKFYQKVDKKTIQKFNEAIDNLQSNPFFGRDIKKLRGKLKGKYRLRVGNLRIVYQVEKEENLILIEAIGQRGGIYLKE